MKKIPALFLFITVSLITVFPQSITFTKKSPAVNDVKYLSLTMNLKIELTMFQDDVPITNFSRQSNKVENKKIKILAVTNDKISKIEIYYEKSQEINKDDELESNKIDPVAGKTYIVEKKNSEIIINYIEGEKPTDEEIQFILNDDFFKFLEVVDFKDKVLKIGDKSPEVENFLKNDFLGITSDKNISNIAVTLNEIKDFNGKKCAVFKLGFTNKSIVAESLTMDFDITGDFYVDINTSAPVKLNLKGPIIMNGKVTNENISAIMKGAGTLEGELSVKK